MEVRSITHFLKGLTLMSLLALLAACSSPNAGRYSQKYDSIPTRLPTAEELVEPEPVAEPLSPQGNRTYSLFGRTWQVMPEATGYVATGIASWYGEKFHGHLTSNGETYDMYAMSAAHKTLPLPTFVRVTNLANNRSVVVRVNDRGPFHQNRIIDLSYAAAYKIGMLNTGTARVKVEAITPGLAQEQVDTLAPIVNKTVEQFYVQVIASSNRDAIQQQALQLAKTYEVPATTATNDGLHKLMLGPFVEAQTEKLIERLKADGYPDVFRVPVSP